MVARMVRDHKVVGSNPVTSTKNRHSREQGGVGFLFGERGGGRDAIRAEYGQGSRMCGMRREVLP